MEHRPTRRDFLTTSAAALAASTLPSFASAQTKPATQTSQPFVRPVWDGPLIDIHQHTHYDGRSDAALLHHQEKLGATQTVLLPAGSSVDMPSTLLGKANGLYAGAGGNDSCAAIADSHPGQYFFFANEVPDLAEARPHIEWWLRKGAKGIGEQKFNLPIDSKEMELLYSLAQEYNVPILMHFQYETFNTGFERFGKILEKWPRVTFIGHAQTFWANIDASNKDNAKALYPKGKVTPGGLTDKYLSDYPNLYADMSAGSGLNALTRDENHARAFIQRHQDKMMYGSDCPDTTAAAPICTGIAQVAAIIRLSPSKDVARKLLHDNAQRLFDL